MADCPQSEVAVKGGATFDALRHHRRLSEAEMIRVKIITVPVPRHEKQTRAYEKEPKQVGTKGMEKLTKTDGSRACNCMASVHLLVGAEPMCDVI